MHNTLPCYKINETFSTAQFFTNYSCLCIMANWLENSVKYVAGVGEARAKLLEKELGIITVGDLLRYYPFR